MIASVRGKAKDGGLSRLRTPIRLGACLLAAAAFLFAATSGMAATTDPPVVDQGMPVVGDTASSGVDPATATTATTDPALTPAPPTAPLGAPPATTADPTLTATSVPPADATPAAPTTTTAPAPTALDPAATTTAAQAPTPDQLSPALLAQVSAASAEPSTPPKSTADAPPPVTVARARPDVDVGSGAKPAPPPPMGDEPPLLAATRQKASRSAALVAGLLPAAPAGANTAAPPPREEVTATRARPVWNEFVWRNAGSLGDGPDLNLGTRALLAIIGMLPFAPVDGPDRTVPPQTQLALLIPVLGLVAFLFATRPIADPRRRGPQSYRAVALKPG